jgi:hypothetical protein
MEILIPSLVKTWKKFNFSSENSIFISEKTGSLLEPDFVNNSFSEEDSALALFFHWRNLV